MACDNTQVLLKFKVRFQDEGRVRGTPIGNSLVIVNDIISVSGIGLGEETVIRLREQDKEVDIPTNVRTLPNLSLQLRLSRSAKGLLVFDFFNEWWDKRHETTKTIFVDMCDRARTPFYTFEYSGSSIKKYMWEDQQLGQTKFAVVDLEFVPYNVTAGVDLTAIGATAISRAAAGAL